MNKVTITTLSDEIADRLVEVIVMHDNTLEYSYQIKAGCVDEYLTEDDVKRLRIMLTTAERQFKSVTK